MTRDMYDLKGTFVFGSTWYIPVHFGRQKVSIINKARKGNVIRFKQNYLCEWIGVSNGGLINISKLIKARTLGEKYIELECPKDKRGNLELNEYVIAVDVARSDSQSNNKTAIVVLKIIRSQSGRIRQVQVVNMVTPPNGLNYKEQSIIVKRLFYKYGGNLDLNKSRVKSIVIDANTIGLGLVDQLLEEVTDPESNEELGCFATINTEQKPAVKDSPAIVYALKAQGINGDIIRTFINYVESSKLKLIKSFDDIRSENDKFELPEIEIKKVALQTQRFIDEVSNLKLKKTQSSTTVEQVIKKIDKDRYSAISYGLYYIDLFMDVVEEKDDSSMMDYCLF